MKYLLLTAALIGSFATVSLDAKADNHGYKGEMMEKVDTNGDGMVSRDEFMAKHEAKFNEMDADNDGNLTKDEMKAAKDTMKKRWKEQKEKAE
jgi:Ca2+-binding EF-hand superfamily protein